MAKGVKCAGYKDDFLKRRFQSRMRSTGVRTYAEYARFIEKNPEEFNDLVDALTINVSEFFRDASVWSVLRDGILPSLIREKIASGSRDLRVWTAGCADGEETYTIAILLLDALAYLSEGFRIQILGTDVDLASLSRARNGEYAAARLRLVDQTAFRRYFIPAKDDNFQIIDAVRKIIAFKPHDLFTPPPEYGFDMISCRNVAIYFSKQQQEELYCNLYNALTGGGYLIIGKVETLIGEASSLFTFANMAERIYRKPMGATVPAVSPAP